MHTTTLTVFRVLATIGSVTFSLTLLPRMFKMQKEPGRSKDLIPAFVPMNMALNGVIWIFIGLASKDVAITATNVWGTCVCYNCYVWYLRGVESQKRFAFGHYFFLVGTFAMVIIATFWAFYDSFTTDRFVKVVSIIGGVTSTLLFFTPFTAILDVLRTKSSEAISLPYTCVSIILTLFWGVVGFGMPAISVWLPNMIGLALSCLQVIFFLVFPRKKASVDVEVEENDTLEEVTHVQITE